MDNSDRVQHVLKLAEALEFLADRLGRREHVEHVVVVRRRLACGDTWPLDREPPDVCPWCEGRRRDWDALTPQERVGLVDPYGDVAAAA